MNNWHVCVVCYRDYETRGKEVVCSPFCKIQNNITKEDEHWFIKGAETMVRPRIKYKRNFYDARIILYQRENYSEPFTLCLQVGCIRPSHHRKVSWFKKIVEWFFVSTPIKGK